LRPAVENEAASETMRLLSEGRGDPVAERTRALNRLHALLRDLLPGRVVSGKLWAERAARILRSIRPKGASARLRRQPASEVLRLE
jgi:transposase